MMTHCCSPNKTKLATKCHSDTWGKRIFSDITQRLQMNMVKKISSLFWCIRICAGTIKAV